MTGFFLDGRSFARVAQRVLTEDKLRLAVVGPHRSDKALRRLLRF